MASGLSVKLPLYHDPDDGSVALNKTYREVAKQNFRNILLTIPGERVMLPDFGVGLKRFLFEQNDALFGSNLRSEISNQVSRYLSYIDILSIDVNNGTELTSGGPHTVSLKIVYNIVPLNIIDEINITREDEDIVFV